MQKITQVQIGIGFTVVAFLVGFLLFGFSPKFLKQSPAASPQTQTSAQTSAALLSVSGKITLVDAKANSFKLTDGQNNQTYTVDLGAKTSLVQIVLPFDVKKPLANKTFTPQRKIATLSDLKTGSKVFVRPLEPIIGYIITNPIEVQILP